MLLYSRLWRHVSLLSAYCKGAKRDEVQGLANPITMHYHPESLITLRHYLSPKFLHHHSSVLSIAYHPSLAPSPAFTIHPGKGRVQGLTSIKTTALQSVYFFHMSKRLAKRERKKRLFNRRSQKCTCIVKVFQMGRPIYSQRCFDSCL